MKKVIEVTIIDPAWDRVNLHSLAHEPPAYMENEEGRFVLTAVSTRYRVNTGASTTLTFEGPLTDEEFREFYGSDEPEPRIDPPG